MKLVASWKDAWKWSSMHAMAGALAIQGAWVAIPEEMHALFHPIITHAMTGLLLVFGIVGRLVDQTKKPDPTDQAGA